MLIIEYDAENGCACSDGNVDSFVARVLDHLPSVKGGDYRVVTANETIITGFRIAIVEGKIPVDAIQFEFRGEVLVHHANGKFEHWPLGFCDTISRQLDRLLSL